MLFNYLKCDNKLSGDVDHRTGAAGREAGREGAKRGGIG